MAAPHPPAPRREPLRIEQLGRVRSDDYAWMKDENWQAILHDPSLLRADIRAHLEAENAYTQAVLAETATLQAAILAEIKGRMKMDEMSLPVPDGEWDYYIRYQPGAQHPIHARRPRGRDIGEQVLVDADALSQGHAYYRIAAMHHSPDHMLFAYAEDAQGSEVYRIQVKRLEDGSLLPHPIENSTGNFVWSPDSRYLFWTWRDAHGRPRKVFRRAIGGQEDVLVYEEADPGFFLHVELTESQAWITIVCGDKETSEIHLIPNEDPTAPPRLVEPRCKGVLYDLTHWDRRFIIRTNADGAVDFKLMAAPEADPARGNWRDWVPHVPGRFIVGMSAFADHFVRVEREDVDNRIVITARADGAEHRVSVAEDAYALTLAGSYEFNTGVVRYIYESPTTPRQWFDYDMRSRERSLRKTQEIPSGHDPAAYVARRLHATAPDGAQVPITALMRRDVAADGTAPLFLYGYGAYGHAIEPNFSIRALSLVDRGWVWAIAHVRGGSERGWGWFLDGRGRNKPNSFTDFIAAAEHLVDAGYGRRGEIVAQGASAGGMLMGAVANLRPDLFAAIIAGVPFVDVLNTMSDTSLPLTPPEWPEWGNPIENPADYDLIASYSPYDCVAAQPYPAILATGGLSDPRVTYWEPAKWVARLRDNTTSTHPVLLKINMEAGHGGAAGRFDILKDVALNYAFAICVRSGNTQSGRLNAGVGRYVSDKLMLLNRFN